MPEREEPTPEPTDAALLHQWRSGDASGFERLVARYEGPLLRHARTLLRQGGAEDVVQETFLSALNNLDSFRQESLFRGSLFRIATNASRMRLRRKRRRPDVGLEIQTGFKSDGHHERPVIDWSPLPTSASRTPNSDVN